MTSNEKTYHHGNLKQALVTAGMELLEQEGLEKLSLRGIAARVGVSHTAPKNHFGSLRGLLTAIGAEGFRRHAAFMRVGLTGAETRKDRLNAAMDGYVRFAQTHPALFELMFSSTTCDYTDEALNTAAEASYQVLAEISQGLDWDKAGTPNAQARTEAMLWSLVHGYARLMLDGQLGMAIAPGDILEILPDFEYLPQQDDSSAENPCA